MRDSLFWNKCLLLWGHDSICVNRRRPTHSAEYSTAKYSCVRELASRYISQMMKRREVQGGRSGRRIVYDSRRGETQNDPPSSRAWPRTFVSSTRTRRTWMGVADGSLSSPDYPWSSFGDSSAPDSSSWNSRPVMLADRDVCPIMCQRYIILWYVSRRPDVALIRGSRQSLLSRCEVRRCFRFCDT